MTVPADRDAASASGRGRRVPLSLLDRANHRRPQPGPDAPRDATQAQSRASDRSGARVPASEVFAEVVNRARRAEDLGFRRFWVAEHHGVPGIAGSTPAVLAAAIASATRRLRVGTGGIMVPDHPPFVVAEQVGTLQALFPGRVDAGLGSSQGFTAPVRRALRQDDDARARFPEDLAEVLAHLEGSASVTAQPADDAATPVFLLAGGGRSLRLAAEHGAGVVLGGPSVLAEGPHEGLAAYRRDFVPSERRGQEPHVIVAVNVKAAPDAAQARELAIPEAWAMARSGSLGAFEALRWPQELDPALLTERERGRFEEHLAAGVQGTPGQVVERLERIVEHTGADELLLTGDTVDPGGQAESDRLLMEAWSRA